MNIQMYGSAESITAALLDDKSVVVPTHWQGGFRYRERHYTIDTVIERISLQTLSLIASTALKDNAEAGRMLQAQLQMHAAELAKTLFDEHCTEAA